MSDLAVDPLGRWLASTSPDGTVRVWDLPLGFTSSDVALRDAACRSSRDELSTIFTAEERSRLKAARGRPWDVCEGRGLGPGPCPRHRPRQ